ncbi:MAG: DUF4920 domain-containing protein [Bacteroidales bacterium]|nr:DUF4920 domain-containing protein [Bacteroidales bacterium]MCF8386825.1 DUF4920 domain-containing protein [Bacteroidales bacterium]MCF8398660.1 DUF4920 domain-containing protein [Bacteroidales bacterium]
MKNIILLILLLGFVAACNQAPKEKDNAKIATEEKKVKGSYGELITTDHAVPVAELKTLMKDTDSLPIKLKGEIVANCQNSGCWMDLKIDEKDELKVTFKDYAFFIPLDSKGKIAYIEGFAKKEIIPVEKLRHYAMDEGKPKSEIEKITEPKMAYTFEASGVLLKDKK